MGGRGNGGASGAHFKTDNANRAAEAIGGKLGIDTVQAVYDARSVIGGSEFASIARVRDLLESQGYSAKESADAIRTLSRAGSGAYVIPTANLKSLTDHQRARAVNIGGEDNHAIRINP